MLDPAIEKLTDSVSALQRDMAQVGTLVERLDITIEKLTEVSSTVSQLLAVQGNRLEVQEKVQEKLQEMVEKRRTEMEQSVKDIYNKISIVETDLQGDMEKNHDKVINKIQELSTQGADQHKEVNERIGRLETWMWTLIGGSTVIAFILSNWDTFLAIIT